MSQYVETHTKSFQTAAAIAPFLRVALNGSNKLAAAAAEETDIGVTDKRATAADDYVSVRLRTAQGTVKMTADGAISREAVCYGADGGKISATANENPIGIALEAASADGDIIEVLRLEKIGASDEKRTQVALTDTATLTAAQMRAGILDGTPTAAATYTTPSAAQLVAAVEKAAVGTAWIVFVNNKAGGAYTITMAGGNGVTADGTLTVAQNVCRAFLVALTNVTSGSEAAILYGIE